MGRREIRKTEFFVPFGSDSGRLYRGSLGSGPCMKDTVDEQFCVEKIRLLFCRAYQTTVENGEIQLTPHSVEPAVLGESTGRQGRGPQRTTVDFRLGVSAKKGKPMVKGELIGKVEEDRVWGGIEGEKMRTEEEGTVALTDGGVFESVESKGVEDLLFAVMNREHGTVFGT